MKGYHSYGGSRGKWKVRKCKLRVCTAFSGIWPISTRKDVRQWLEALITYHNYRSHRWITGTKSVPASKLFWASDPCLPQLWRSASWTIPYSSGLISWDFREVHYQPLLRGHTPLLLCPHGKAETQAGYFRLGEKPILRTTDGTESYSKQAQTDFAGDGTAGIVDLLCQWLKLQTIKEHTFL